MSDGRDGGLNDGWFCARNGEPVGPVTTAQIRQQMQSAPGEALLIWRTGMAQWTDARMVAEIVDGAAAARRGGLWRRIRQEIIAFLRIAGYLWVCFGALTIYKAAVLREAGVDFAPFGLALVKAMILAKFIMLIEALKIDEKLLRVEAPALVVAQKSAAFTVLLFLLNLLEELIVGRFHGQGPAEVLGEIAGGSAAEMAAVCLLMFLIMIPFFAFREIGFDAFARSGRK